MNAQTGDTIIYIWIETVHRAFVELRKQNLILGRRSDAEVDGYSNFVFVSGNGQPLAINAVNSFLLNMEKAYNKAHPEEAIPHLSAHILRHTGCTLLALSRNPSSAISAVDFVCQKKKYVNRMSKWVK